MTPERTSAAWKGCGFLWNIWGRMFSKDKPFPTRNKADGLQTKWIWCEPFLQVCHTRCLKVSDAAGSWGLKTWNYNITLKEKVVSMLCPQQMGSPDGCLETVSQRNVFYEPCFFWGVFVLTVFGMLHCGINFRVNLVSRNKQKAFFQTNSHPIPDTTQSQLS